MTFEIVVSISALVKSAFLAPLPVFSLLITPPVSITYNEKRYKKTHYTASVRQSSSSLPKPQSKVIADSMEETSKITPPETLNALYPINDLL